MPGRLVEAWLEGEFTLVSSAEQVVELERVLAYPRIRKRIAPHEAEIIASELRNLSDQVTPVSGIEASADSDDNVILATAIAGEVDLIVSGDEPGMLALESIEGIPIVRPSEAVHRLGLKLP